MWASVREEGSTGDQREASCPPSNWWDLPELREVGDGFPKPSRRHCIPEVLVCKGDSQKPLVHPPVSGYSYTQVIPGNQALGKLSLYQLWKTKYGCRFTMFFIRPLLASSASLHGNRVKWIHGPGKGGPGLVSMKSSCDNNPVYFGSGD